MTQTSYWNGENWVYIDSDPITQATEERFTTIENTKNSVYYASSPPEDNPPGTIKENDLWFDTEHGHKPHRWSGSSSPPGWVAAPLSREAIGTLSAGSITANNLEANLVLTNNIYAGSMTGAHANLNEFGLTGRIVHPETNELVETFKLGSKDSPDTFQLRNTDGLVSASIDQEGNATFLSVDARKIKVSGIDVALTSMLEQMPRGVISYSEITTNSPTLSDTVEQPYFSFDSQLEANRMYRITVSPPIVDASAAGPRLESRMRYTTDGTAPTVTSPSFGTVAVCQPPTAESVSGAPYVGYFQTGSIAPLVRFLYTVKKPTGTGSVYIMADASISLEVTVEDIGQATPASAIAVRRTSIWLSASSRAYDTLGPRTDATYNGYYKTPLTVGPCTGGRSNWSHVLFGGNAISGETTATVATATSGATTTIEKVEVYLQCQYGSGQAKIYASTNTALTQTQPTGTPVVASFSDGAGKWVDITNIWTPAMRSIYVIGSAHLHFRSAFAPEDADRPQLRISYRR